MPRFSTTCLAIGTLALALSSQSPALADAGSSSLGVTAPLSLETPLSYEDEQNILFVATCVGTLWPEGMPVVAANTADLPAGTVRYLDAHFFLDSQTRLHPGLAPDIEAQIARVPSWMNETAAQDPSIVADLAHECGIFLEEWLPARSFGA